MSFSGIIGHDAAIERLRASIRSGRVAHGYIFAGPAGVGKTAVAAEFARALLCESGKDDSCGECVSCRKFEHGNHPGFEKVEPAGEGRLIKVELIEELHDAGTTILVITHNREIAIRFPRQVTLRDGMIESDTALQGVGG